MDLGGIQANPSRLSPAQRQGEARPSDLGTVAFPDAPSSGKLSQLPSKLPTSSSTAGSCTPHFLHVTSVLPPPPRATAAHPGSVPLPSAQATVRKALVRPPLQERRSAACMLLNTKGLKPVCSGQIPCQYPAVESLQPIHPSTAPT